MSKIRNAASVTFCLLLVAIASSCGTSHSGPTLTGIDLNPISPNILVNHTQQFTATGHFSGQATKAEAATSDLRKLPVLVH